MDDYPPVVSQVPSSPQLPGLEPEAGSIPFNRPQQVSSKHVVVEQRVGYVVMGLIFLSIVGATTPALVWAISPWWGRALLIGGWVLLAIASIWLAHFWPVLAHKHTWWTLTPAGFEIQRGVWWQHRLAVPAARVQHVDVSQGPIQRLVGLGKLTLHTAGTKNASVELDGLEHSVAMALRDFLIEQKESTDVL